jgi:hypothetical protein
LSDDAYLCAGCLTGFTDDVKLIPEMFAELETTITRQSRLSDNAGGGKSAETPVVFHVAASNAKHALNSELVGLVRELESGPVAGPSCVWCSHLSCVLVRRPDDTRSAVAYVLARAESLRRHPAAGELTGSLRNACTEAMRWIDREDEPLRLGECGAEVDGLVCRAEITATPGQVVVQCPACKSRHEVARRKDALLDRARGELVIGPMVSTALELMEMRCTPATVRSWVLRGRLLARDHVLGKPRYRVGDAVDLWLAENARRHEVAKRKAEKVKRLEQRKAKAKATAAA